MAQTPTLNELQEFALNFDKNIEQPLVQAGYDSCNIFDILNIKRRELSHSDFLAFLFDPNKSGEIGREFLQNFLARLVKDNETEKIDFYHALYGKISKLKVDREFVIRDGQIDILIDFEIVKETKQNVVIVIENKVDSGQNGDQLKRYEEYLATSKYDGYEKIKLYLTKDNSNPNREGWVSTNYEFIYEVLKNINIENTDDSIKILIEDYKKLIRREFMNDSKEIKAAQEIYKNNREILDFIFEHKPDGISKTAEFLCDSLEDHGATIVTVNSKGELRKTEKRDYTNLVFTIERLANYPKHYFQINVKDFLLFFRKDLTHNQCPQKWLFENNQKSSDEAKKFQELSVNDTDQLKEQCKQLINRMFAQDGIIDQCLATLKK